MRNVFFFVIIFSLAAAIFGQSRRIAPAATLKQAGPTTSSDAEQTLLQMFEEANTYVKKKASEFEQKKVPYSDSLLLQTQRERRQLAAKYASIASQRNGLSGEDFYYLGLLHWIAEN